MMLNERENSQQYTDQSYNFVVAMLKYIVAIVPEECSVCILIKFTDHLLFECGY